MNTRRVILATMITTICGAFAENVPPELKKALYDTTNYWGKTNNTRQYYKARQQCLDKINEYDDKTLVIGEWQESFLRFLKDNTVVDRIWMQESADEMFVSSYSKITKHYTNCWFIAAEYAKKLTEKEKIAKKELDEAYATNRFDMSSEWAQHRSAARNRWVIIDGALSQTMRATTNSYPRWILPTLPPEEGAALYTNVLRRAGLVQ